MNRLPQIEEHTACDVCHRTMLKGEWAEPYLTPSRERRLVCQLCAPHAQREGWIRETAAPDAPEAVDLHANLNDSWKAATH